MTALRVLAVGFALVAMVGEGVRSWGVGRPVAFWMDDVLMGTLLIAGAVVTGRETPQRRAFFSGAWGVAVGMAYLSFFEKVFAPEAQNPGNLPLELLTALAGLGLAVAVISLIASVVLPQMRRRRRRGLGSGHEQRESRRDAHACRPFLPRYGDVWTTCCASRSRASLRAGSRDEMLRRDGRKHPTSLGWDPERAHQRSWVGGQARASAVFQRPLRKRSVSIVALTM